MDKYERRRQRLIELRNTQCGGSAAELSRRINREPSYVSRMLYEEGKAGKKRIADDMMEIIETAFHLPRGWMDAVDSAAVATYIPSSEAKGAAKSDIVEALEQAKRDLASANGLYCAQEPNVPEDFAQRADFSRTVKLVDHAIEIARMGGLVTREPAVRSYADFCEIPVLDVAGSMGPGILMPEHDEVVEKMTVSKSWLSKNVAASSVQNLALISAFGDSMEGTFRDGDLLLVDRGVNEIKIDAVYVLALHDELYITRLQRRPDGSFLMISDNRKYEPYLIQNAEREKFRVLGRVVMAWNSVKL